MPSLWQSGQILLRISSYCFNSCPKDLLLPVCKRLVYLCIGCCQLPFSTAFLCYYSCVIFNSPTAVTLSIENDVIKDVFRADCTSKPIFLQRWYANTEYFVNMPYKNVVCFEWSYNRPVGKTFKPALILVSQFYFVGLFYINHSICLFVAPISHIFLFSFFARKLALVKC